MTSEWNGRFANRLYEGGKRDREGVMATRFFSLRFAAFRMTCGKGGMGPRIREDNGWGRTPAATEGENGRDEGLGNGRFANRPYEGGKREGEGAMATRFFDSASLRSE